MRNLYNTEQPIFIDLIIKLHMCRAYANNSMKKSLTADRCLKDASAIIDQINENIFESKVERHLAFHRSVRRVSKTVDVNELNCLEILEDVSTNP